MTMPARGRATEGPPYALAVGVAAGLAIVGHATGVGCPLLETTGFACPLCGGTRSFANLVTGRFGAALHNNAVVATAGGVLVIRLLLSVVRARRLYQFVDQLLSSIRLRHLIIAACIWFVLRNVPPLASILSP